MKKSRNKSSKSLKETFQIPQIPKVDGLRSPHKYVKERFVSPMFGADVKDEVHAPFVVRVIGDKVKKYDAFRTKPLMDEEAVIKKYGTKYYEFKNSTISKETRKEIYGIDTYLKDNKSEEVEFETKKIEPNIAAQIYGEPSLEQEESENIPIWMKSRNHNMEPIESEVVIETHKRPMNEINVKTNFEKDFNESTLNKVSIQKTEREKVLTPKPKEVVGSYQLPPVSLLNKTNRNVDAKPAWLLHQIKVINQTFIDHAVEGEVADSKKGPTVTRHEISLEPGVPVKRVTSIHDNIMMNLAAKTLRIEAPIPGKPFVGIEVPNDVPEIVSFGNIVDTKEFLEDYDHPLKVALGEDIDGTNIYVDIAKMPHGLIAGATNSGKSVCVNSILISLLLKNKPDDLKLILIDPKMVELTPYNSLPHLLTPVITDPKMAATALGWVVDQMEERYKKFAETRSRDITSYNQKYKNGFVDEKMPYIVIVIDELADLMSVSAQDVENYIQRITQKARAAGIHLLVATQRPTVDVVRGTIKSNIPTRIAFRVASFTDSTTILDGAGAEQLLGRGDMLLKELDRPIRLQGAYISDDEIDKVIDFITAQQGPSYQINHEELKIKLETKDLAFEDELVDVAFFVLEENTCSMNSIQKKFNMGFNKAQRAVSQLESLGVVSDQQGTKARDVLVTEVELVEILREVGLI